MFTINYNTGVIKTAKTLNAAMQVADDNVSYTQQSISIEDKNGDEAAVRSWNGTTEGVEEYENPIQFGDYGYYTDWIIV